MNNGSHPYVLLRSATGAQYRMAAYLRLEMTKLYQLQEQERETRNSATPRQFHPFLQEVHRTHGCPLSDLRNAGKFHDRPAAADIAFCVAAFSLRMPEDSIATTLDSLYLSRDPNPSRKSAYIKRTMA